LFQLLYDATRNVLLTRLSGVFTEEDIVLRDRHVAWFVARHGLARGLMDYSGISRVDIPLDVIVRRAQGPPMLPGQTRVVVAPNEPAYSLNRVIVAHQYLSRKVEPLVVGSLQDAYYALGSARFDFVPVEEDEHMRLERTALTALTTIDAQGRKQADHYRQQSATSRQRMAEAEAASPMMGRRRPSFITASDLFNTMLRHTRLSDGDLSIRCPRCLRDTTLAGCPVSGRRQTTYRCPACQARLVELVPLQGGCSGETSGYSFGGFDVQTRTDIICHGIVLPTSHKTPASGKR
jgi:hypothetical protein